MLLPLISMATLAGRLRRFGHNSSGSAAVEFAMIAPVFFALIFAIMETGMVFFAGQVLETAVEDGARSVYTCSAAAKVVDFKTPICARTSALMDCAKIDIDVRSYDPGTTINISNPIDAGGNYVSTNFVYEPPACPTSKTVVVRAFYQWPLYVTGLGYNIANIDRLKTTNKRLLAATAATGPQ
ncbi:TadE/TadG family type IV pilus assembly protein [Tardiphaga sp. 42S5]|uniref:TadE/TadG family type IV pilus assembly protein n=1 Tax=unclassified Tardiphaga TaxID=2631404 RepID=UPI002A5AA02B|nr:TadE/TadG family type IV pilus assembly protein [Tardiphaga sp. 42S5]WPO43692.1 TadE/TadG family type IV pilus assembly protein [Tardiphaga sp. 42S5]